MRKILMAMVVSGAALLGVGAHAAEPIPALTVPHVQAVDWDGWHHDGWRRREEWRRWHRHEQWARRHHWHDGWNGYNR